jgi:prephenate dehydratase
MRGSTVVSSSTSPSVGTLGSVLTFAGQATAALLSRRPELGEPAYLPTMDAVVEAVLDGTIDLGVLTSETSRTACTDTVARMLAGDRLYVVDEILVPYHCALQVKPGTRLEQIKHVGGHGSIRQCGDFLRTRLPGVTAAMHRQNSVVAAREVLEGDGSTAVIATEALAAEFGLEILEHDVDGGAVGGWWALSADLRRPDGADHLALRIDGAGALAVAMARLDEAGLVVRTVTNQPTGELFAYRYLLTAHTADGRALDAAIVDAFGDQVVGVFTSTTVV